MKCHDWTDQQVATLRRLYPDNLARDVAAVTGMPTSAVYAKAAALGLRKSRAFYTSPNSGRTNGTQGGATRFKAGHKTWNKGLSYVAGGRSLETQFKKGQLNGRAAQRLVPVGTLTVNADGVLDRKVSDISGVARHINWKPVHRLVWEEANGPIPEGMAVVFRPGMKTVDVDQITIDKLELLTRGGLMARNSRHNLPKELSNLIQLRGALTRQINRRNKENAK